MRKNEVINKAINEGINEVIKGEKNTFLFQGLKITKMAILLTKLMNVRYKNFLGVFFKKRQIAISYVTKSLKIGIICFRLGIKMPLLKPRLFNA
ncbi:hypothetical protein C3H94_08325 [Campylobacter jejuni]|uniref:hypothetical protein n=1 Tax=Campylobacter jejuni TaxID=197 RepID=UPI000F80E59A|nr:hypothetical protein [Campylobacter jejuni]RTJ06894.1 hypothetical protein C3H94_08325 [Campylobacter jejuni]